MTDAKKVDALNDTPCNATDYDTTISVHCSLNIMD